MEGGVTDTNHFFDEVDVKRYKAAGVYTLDDFRKMEKGTIAILHFKCINKGEFVWQHDRVEGNSVFGQLAHSGAQFSQVDGYLYKFGEFVCKGSGAEPVCRKMPEDRGEEGEDYGDW